jgi:hypothetical protein
MDISRILAVVTLIAVVTAIVLLIVDPASANTPIPSTYYRGAPGPIAGAGLLTVGIGAGVYWLFRPFRKNKLRSPSAT